MTHPVSCPSDLFGEIPPRSWISQRRCSAANSTESDLKTVKDVDGPRLFQQPVFRDWQRHVFQQSTCSLVTDSSQMIWKVRSEAHHRRGEADKRYPISSSRCARATLNRDGQEAGQLPRQPLPSSPLKKNVVDSECERLRLALIKDNTL